MESRYIYPAIISIQDDSYNVDFPDLDNCFTFGENLEDALDSAKDVLMLYLYDMEEDGLPIPKSSNLESLTVGENQIATLIDVWMIPFRDKMKNVSVKKTITIPSWLNDIGLEQDINFSQVLQSAIKEMVGVKEQQSK